MASTIFASPILTSVASAQCEEYGAMRAKVPLALFLVIAQPGI